ncbi:hypothetical protein Baya_10559 [Bagarius yarrelli]|uniref:Uncharacterized protein n=1 Tax=Bagarius yarrelli TaxID=175774 RepID=A0A556UFU7_BAGYA|nr:hypothetical protein Baya_10559 [Bagarius yarrelli]
MVTRLLRDPRGAFSHLHLLQFLFASYNTYPFQSLSVESYGLTTTYTQVRSAQYGICPSTSGSRKHAFPDPFNITLWVAMLVSSFEQHIFKFVCMWEEGPLQFVKIQTSKPPVSANPLHPRRFRLKESGRLHSIYRWNARLLLAPIAPPLHRATHIPSLRWTVKPANPVELLTGSGGVPVEPCTKFVFHSRSHMQVMSTGKALLGPSGALACLTRFIATRFGALGSQRFVEIRRGLRVAQCSATVSVGVRQYLVLFSDYSFSQIYLCNELHSASNLSMSLTFWRLVALAWYPLTTKTLARRQL